MTFRGNPDFRGPPNDQYQLCWHPFWEDLYSMCDRGSCSCSFIDWVRNILWDKSATIHFRRPGKGKVTAVFRLSHEDIESVRKELESARKVTPTFVAEIRDENGSASQRWRR